MGGDRFANILASTSFFQHFHISLNSFLFRVRNNRNLLLLSRICTGGGGGAVCQNIFFLLYRRQASRTELGLGRSLSNLQPSGVLNYFTQASSIKWIPLVNILKFSHPGHFYSNHSNFEMFFQLSRTNSKIYVNIAVPLLICKAHSF